MATTINDISTDLDNPPKFRHADIGDLPDKFKPVISQTYPDLAPLVLTDQPAAKVWAAAVAVAEGTPRWQLTVADEPRYLEGVATSLILRFKDDFIIRMTPRGDTVTVVDMRSRSRVGKGDLGTNASRIRKFLKELKEELSDDT